MLIMCFARGQIVRCLIQFVAICWLSILPSNADKAADFAFHFVDAYASSTNPGASPAEFNAKRALQPGTGYWCSEGSHPEETIVSWVGTLNSGTTLKGLRIEWTYSPKEIQILTSQDGVNEAVALPWHRTPSDKAAFTEEVYFEKPMPATTVKVLMRGALNKYFGIQQIVPIAAGRPVVLLISGITHGSSGDICLQVEGGALNQNRAPVVLDTCHYAMAAGDGRELWRQNERMQLEAVMSRPPKCISLLGLNTTRGLKVHGTRSPGPLWETFTRSRALYFGLQRIRGPRNLVGAALGFSGYLEGDRRSEWELQMNGQIVLSALNSRYALSQSPAAGIEGGVGYTDLVRAGRGTASSVADSSHGPSLAMDGDPKTYWASGAFDDAEEHLVVYDVDLGSPHLLHQVRTDWEFPPFHYAISVSVDAASYMQVAETLANPANVTTDEITLQTPMRFVRLSMHRPHPRYGRMRGDKLGYGIRSLQIFSRRLKTIVQDVREAANTPDARDKWFMKPARGFDASISSRLMTMEAEMHSRLKGVQSAVSEVTQLLPHAVKCLESMRSGTSRMSDNYSKFAAMKRQSHDLHADEMNLNAAQLAAGLQLGSTRALPASDCSSLRARSELREYLIPTGFYWFNPQCSPHPFRAWCDMDTGTMIHVIYEGLESSSPADGAVGTGTKTSFKPLKNVATFEELALKCAERGLEPLSIFDQKTIKNAVSALKLIGVPLDSDSAVPLANDPHCFEGRCTGKYRDLITGSDVTSVLIASTTPEQAQTALSGSNTAGLGLGADGNVVFYNWDGGKIAAILCSTNTGYGDIHSSPVPIECNTVARGNQLFQGSPDTNVLVACPPGCEAHSDLRVFGADGVYHEASSVCRAAIHAGVVPSGGVVNVALELGKARYSGTLENGIESQALINDDNGRTIRIGPVPKECPVERLAESKGVNLEASQKHAVEEGVGAVPTSGERKLASFLQISANAGGPAGITGGVVTTEEMNRVLEDTFQAIEELHGIDPHVMKIVQESTAGTISAGRGQLKPVEKLQQSTTLQVSQLYSQTEEFTDVLFTVTGEAFSALEAEAALIDSLTRRQALITAPGEWLFDPAVHPTTSADLFSTQIRLSQSAETVSGEPQWGVDAMGLHQSGNVVRDASAYGSGTFALVRNRQWFDFVFTATLTVNDGDSAIAGVAFRMRDPENGYVVELDKQIGVRRLVRLHQGRATVLCEKVDGGYVTGAEYFIHVETSHGRVRVCIREGPGGDLEQLFDFQDETFVSKGFLERFSRAFRKTVYFFPQVSGSVGAFSSDTSSAATVTWSSMRVEPKYCTEMACATSHAPQTPACNFFADLYSRRLDLLYETQGTGSWRYIKNDIGAGPGGRSVVLAAISPAGKSDSASLVQRFELPDQWLIATRPSCNTGQLSVDTYVAKGSPKIYLIFNYSGNADFSAVVYESNHVPLLIHQRPYGPMSYVYPEKGYHNLTGPAENIFFSMPAKPPSSESVKPETLPSQGSSPQERKWRTLKLSFSNSEVKLVVHPLEASSEETVEFLFSVLPVVANEKSTGHRRSKIGLGVNGEQPYAIFFDRLNVSPVPIKFSVD